MPELPESPCCDTMRRQLDWSCRVHVDPFDCGDALVWFMPKYDEFGLIIHDGGSSVSVIAFCPWCGVQLPESRRDRWHEELEARGIDPHEDEIPAEFADHRWMESAGIRRGGGGTDG